MSCSMCTQILFFKAIKMCAVQSFHPDNGTVQINKLKPKVFHNIHVNYEWI